MPTTRSGRMLAALLFLAASVATLNVTLWLQYRDTRAALEAELARQIPEMNLERRLHAADRRAVALGLPEGVALVEFVRFDVFDFHAVPARGERRWNPARYLAFVLPAGEPDDVRMIDLGEAGPIDRMIADFRAGIIEPTDDHPDRNMAVKHAGRTVAFDLHPAAYEAIAGTRAERAASVADVAGAADVIFLSLPGGAQVRKVCLGEGGIAGAARRGTAVVDLSTTPVELAREMERELATSGIAFADAPVARTREAAPSCSGASRACQ